LATGIHAGVVAFAPKADIRFKSAFYSGRHAFG